VTPLAMEGEILVKIHKSHRIVVAICDKNIYGKILEDGKRSLDLTTRFFDGESVSLDELKEIIINYVREDATFNIVGKKSVSMAKELGVIKDEGIIDISGIPYALILL
jgi:hypothetical protein